MEPSAASALFAGADVDERSSDGWSALHYAAAYLGDEGADVAGEDETGETDRLEVSRRRHGAEADDGHVPDAKAENGEHVGDGEGGDDGVAGRRRGRDDEESTQTERGVDDAADDEDGPRRGGG